MFPPHILPYLMIKTLGYDYPKRGHQSPIRYPWGSAPQHLVCLINGSCGSDGDLFAQSFKELKLGTLIGTRTWGGTIGIFPRVSLVDGTSTTQPEFEIVFNKGELRIENEGVEPDITVEITPEDYENKRDSQLLRGLRAPEAETLRDELKRNFYLKRFLLFVPLKDTIQSLLMKGISPASLLFC